MVISKFMAQPVEKKKTQADEAAAARDDLSRMPVIIDGKGKFDAYYARLMRGPVPTWMEPPKKKQTALEKEREKHGDVEVDCHGELVKDCGGNAIPKKK